MSDATEHIYAILTWRGSAPHWTCRALSPAHAFQWWLTEHPNRKRNLSSAPQETVYSERLSRFVWTEHVQSAAGRTIVVKGAALVCPGGYVTPSDFKADAEVPA